MNTIASHLWYDTQALEAVEFYSKVFKDVHILQKNVIENTPSGKVDIVHVRIFDHEFICINAGPDFHFTPAISHLVNCSSAKEVDAYYATLIEGGKPLMELGSYPFSSRYAWLQDKYGLSWQLYCTDGKKSPARIIPTLMFIGKNAGKAEEAIQMYTSIFHGSINYTMRYGAGEEPDKKGTLRHAGFVLNGQHFAAMDSAHPHGFTFNEALSFLIYCDTQEEIDYYWSKLSSDPQAEQCGWVKDKYGISWQVHPRIVDKMFSDPDKKKVQKVVDIVMKMKKLDIASLQKVYRE